VGAAETGLPLRPDREVADVRRRELLKIGGVTCASALVGAPLRAEGAEEPPAEFRGVLVDVFRCTGCRKCEEACAETHGLPMPDIRDRSVFDHPRETSPTQRTVVQQYPGPDRPLYVKRQCFHCNQPACAAACLVRAMRKRETGPITWNSSNCMGCRYCMVSCPFDVPKFEYDSAVPRIVKCDMCWDRLQEGKVPACVEACPVEALNFGTRRELLELARTRIYTTPDTYVHEVYGEHEVGGTGWMYVSPVPFDRIGFRTDLGTTPYPEYTKDFLYSVPFILALWPAFLFGASEVTRGRRESAAHAGDGNHSGDREREDEP